MHSISRDPKKTSTHIANWEIVSTHNFETLCENMCSKVWSGSLFLPFMRKEANFVGAYICALDYDEGMTLLEAKDFFADYKHIIAPSKSSGIDKDGTGARDRFRVALWFDKPVFNLYHYRENMREIVREFGSDPVCFDAARYWSPSTSIYSKSNHGLRVKTRYDFPPEEEKKSEASAFVQRHKVNKTFPGYVLSTLDGNLPEGSRNKKIFKTACFFFECGWEYEKVLETFEEIPGYLAHKGGRSTIDSAARRCGATIWGG